MNKTDTILHGVFHLVVEIDFKQLNKYIIMSCAVLEKKEQEGSGAVEVVPL